jgi:outer membrane protein TolC
MNITIRARHTIAAFGAALTLLLLLAPTTAWAQAATTATPVTGQGPTLPLSMNEAVAMSLESNLNLKAERLNVDVAAHSVAIARSAFLPIVDGGLSRRSSRSVPSDFTQGSEDITSTNLGVNGGVSQLLPWYGSSYNADWSGGRNTQQGGISPFNPRLGSTLQLQFAQPLLRGFRLDSARVGLQSAERRRAISDIQIEQRIVSTEASVRLAYLNLVASIEGRKVAEENLNIAQQSLNQSRERVKVGVSPEIEIIQAEAQVASNRERLILADAQIATAEDFLRGLVLDPARADYWQVRIVPTDKIQLTPRDIDLDAVIKTALANRLDLIVERRSLEITDLNLDLNRNSLLPAVNLNASYLAQGTAGTQFEFGSGFPPPILSQTDRSFGSALSDTFGGAYPTWSVGLNVSYPLGRSSVKAQYAQGQVLKRQQELGIQQLQLQIVAQVRDAVRGVQNSYQRVQAAQSARQASEQQLEAEERRFAVGLSTTLELQVRQRDLAQSRIVELDAMISYNRALILLDRVQKTGAF